MKKITLFTMLFAFLLGWQMKGQVLTEDFESGALPTGWTVEYVSGTVDWTYENGGHSGNPAAAHGGSFNALFYQSNYAGNTTKLVTPEMDITGLTNPEVNLWHAQKVWAGDQDTFRVYYKAAAADAWTLLVEYTNDIPDWTEEHIALPNPSATYYLAFEALGAYGYGVALDDIAVQEAPAYLTPVFDLSLTNVDCANTGNEFSVEVNVTDLGGSNSVTVSDDQGSATQQLSAAGAVTFGPYASGTTINFTVTSDDDNTISATDMISYTCPTTPGDDCYNAIAATVYAAGGGAGNEIAVDAATLSDSGAHPTCDDYGTNLDVWFAVTVPAGQTGFKATFTGNAADHVESALWDACGGNELACNAANSSGIIIFDGLTAGQTYYVQLWLDDFNSDTFSVVYEELPQAPNCASNPTPADGATVTVLSGRKVELSWDAPTSGPAPTHYKIQAGTTSGTYPIEATFDATTMPNPLPFTGLADATTYYWKVTPINNGVEATGCPEWSFTTQYPAAPANDSCAGAIALTVDPDACVTPTVADNSFATDSGEAAPSCASYNGGDLWFTVTVPASGSVTIEASEVAGSYLSDTGMAVYSGTCGSLTEIDCNDDNANSLFSMIELTGQTQNDVLYVRVWSYNNGGAGEFNLCAWDPLAAIEDNQIAGFKFYPNPVNNTLNLSAQNNIDLVSVTNIAGQEVMKLTPNAAQTQIDMSHLQNGIYFVKAQINGEVTAFKIIKK